VATLARSADASQTFGKYLAEQGSEVSRPTCNPYRVHGLSGGSGIDVQGEVVTVFTEGRDNEMYLVLHEPGDEVHVSRQAVEPRDHQWAARATSLLERCCKARAQQKRILSSTGLNILIPRFDPETFARSERFNVTTLRRQPQSAAALFARADS
jgi:hypothetical protein